MLPLDAVADRRGRARARCSRARGRLAGRPRRLAGGRRRARLDLRAPTAAEIVTGTRVERIDELDDAGAVLLDLTPRQIVAIAGRPAAGPLPPRARALPLRPRRLQARLGARRPDPVDGAGVRAAPARCTSAARSRRSRPRRRAPTGARRAPVRAALAADGLRPDPRAGGQAHRLGVLPRADRLDRGHDRRDRGAGRALRARLPRADPRPRVDERRRDGGLQRQLRRRRHQRRR